MRIRPEDRCPLSASSLQFQVFLIKNPTSYRTNKKRSGIIVHYHIMLKVLNIMCISINVTYSIIVNFMVSALAV